MLLGVEIVELAPTHARARLEIDERLRQRWGFLHGGVHACLAGTLAFEATAPQVRPAGLMPIGLSNDVKFVRPVADGVLHATASPRHWGRTTVIWDVELRDDDDRLCAMARVTLALRPHPDEPAGHLPAAHGHHPARG